ncbi:MAG: undecaprenyldiphospho-muramoylpentapeptide beta-N-acetylglucosaminyltransferase [Burkholderiales bacterium 28-67-8]|nr:MAG: undecaprenyldiphospho-muramoylpentapeptide beta-N-acetylglucosaminyltransferase [Burkholderiales bacterium 28-67-8]
MSHKHLLIVAAGTGGHVIPGLAVAAEVQRRGWTVSWLGTTTGMENKLVPPSGIEMDTVAFTGLRGKGLAHTLGGVVRLFAALGRCAQVIRRRRAQVVLGMGGYLCFPAGVMAALLRKPLMLVNADAALLLSNRALLSVADRIAFGFDGPAAHETRRSVVTGNPVRAAIEALPVPAQRFADRTGPLRLLVVGGSLGAQALNRCVPQALALLPEAERPQVTHQTGAAQIDAVRAGYGEAGVEAEVLPFIDNMAERLAACDVIVCRAGAITVSELCAAGVASVLVPLVASTTSHQRDNAQWMASHGAALHLPQTELTPRHLADVVAGFTRDALLAMATQARALARPKAAERVADELERLVLA